MKHKSLYEPEDGIMKCAVFASGSGTNFREAVLESRKPGSNFSIDLLVTDKETKKGEIIGAISYAEKFGIAKKTVNGLRWCNSWKEAQQTVEGRINYEINCQVYNLELLRVVQEYETEKNITFDFAVLAGYMRIFKGALLRRFNSRAINVHPANLNKMNEIRFRRYTGENAVFDALNAEETKTRSSVILVDPDTDAGAILTSGHWLDYNGTRPVTQKDADTHQEMQKRKSDWPALRFTLKAIANGEIALHNRKFHPDGNPVVLYNGREMPYQGVDVEGY